ncbi:MAG: Dabb family protein [Myxococcota bacterium]
MHARWTKGEEATVIIAEDRIEVASRNRAALLARIRDEYAPAAARRGLQLVGAFVSPPFDLLDQPGLLRVRWRIEGIEAWWAMRAAANDPAVPAFWASLAPLIGSRERRYWVEEPIEGDERSALTRWPDPVPTAPCEIATQGWRETVQLHLPSYAPKASIESLAAQLGDASRSLPGLEAVWIAPNFVADYGAGHLTWDLLFPDRASADAARQSAPWRDEIAPTLVRDCQAWTALGLETIGAGLRRRDLKEGVKRTALFRKLPDAAPEALARFERDLLEMPAHVPAILNWRLARAVRLDWSSADAPAWSHVWEQEYDRLEGLTVDYMVHPHHWAHVDRWFDPESGCQIIDAQLCHAFSPLSGSILGRDERR